MAAEGRRPLTVDTSARRAGPSASTSRGSPPTPRPSVPATPRTAIGLSRPNVVNQVAALDSSSGPPSSDAGLNQEFIEEMMSRMTIKRFKAGEYIVRVGEIGNEMFFITKGVVGIQLPNKVINLGEGAFFGEVALFLQGKRMASITAQSDVDVLVLKKKVLDKVLEKWPSVKAQFEELGRSRLQMNANGTTGTAATSGAAWMSKIAETSVGYDPTVQVMIRIRPQNAREKKDKEYQCVFRIDEKHVEAYDPRAAPNEAEGQRNGFKFDYIFDEDTTNEVIYEKSVFRVLDSTFDSYNTCLFAYGQTGTGKTYTISGLTSIILREMFTRINKEETEDPHTKYALQVSYLEIYCERLKDLLHPGGGRHTPDLPIRGTPEKGIYVEALSRKPVQSLEQLTRMIEAGDRLRTITTTKDNAKNSHPGHSILTLYLRKTQTDDEGGNEVIECKMNLVDLAGTTREKDNAGKTALDLAREEVDRRGKGEDADSQSINTSLLSLSLVINKLAFDSKNIPYRQSKLTLLLAESFGGNSKTYMIATLGPSALKISLRTLRHAQYAMNIVNKAVRATPKGAVAKRMREAMSDFGSLLSATPTGDEPPPEVAVEEPEDKTQLESIMRLIEEANALCAKTGNKIVFSIQPHDELSNASRYGVRITDFESTKSQLWDPIDFERRLREEEKWVEENWDNDNYTLKETADINLEPFHIDPPDHLIGTIIVPLTSLASLTPVNQTFQLDSPDGTGEMKLNIRPLGATGKTLRQHVDTNLPFMFEIPSIENLNTDYNCGVYVRYAFPFDELEENINTTTRTAGTPATRAQFNHMHTVHTPITAEFCDAIENQEMPQELTFEVWGHEADELYCPRKLRVMLTDMQAELNAEREKSKKMQTTNEELTKKLDELNQQLADNEARRKQREEALRQKAKEKIEEARRVSENKVSEMESAQAQKITTGTVAQRLMYAVQRTIRLDRDHWMERCKMAENDYAELFEHNHELNHSNTTLKEELKKKEEDFKHELVVSQNKTESLRKRLEDLETEMKALRKAHADQLEEKDIKIKDKSELLHKLKAMLATRDSDIETLHADLKIKSDAVEELMRERDSRKHAYAEMCRMYSIVKRLGQTERQLEVSSPSPAKRPVS